MLVDEIAAKLLPGLSAIVGEAVLKLGESTGALLDGLTVTITIKRKGV